MLFLQEFMKKTYKCAVMFRQGYAVDSAGIAWTACLGKNSMKYIVPANSAGVKDIKWLYRS